MTPTHRGVEQSLDSFPENVFTAWPVSVKNQQNKSLELSPSMGFHVNGNWLKQCFVNKT